MNITIVGAGNMARGIATRALVGGHDVTITAKDPDKAVQLADELSEQDHGGQVAAGDESALDRADIVVLAVPFAAAEQLAASYGPRLGGKVLIDISNPVDGTLDALVVNPGTSAAERIAAAAGEQVRVVKAFNTTFATTLVSGHVGGTALDVFLAGDDEATRKEVADLVASGELNPVDVGALKHARELEGFQLLHMALQIREGGHNWASTIKSVAP
ncbi:NADPH-dependent F420 reductase [Streptomyces griseorubiginosus]|uniref:Pyrroline-5-carboxylate reductase n=1 Tax=Streptomyces griseorubiginosus TaxID=67304 RepID=A0AAI8L9J4_9ACTN|nr:NAD(P)-binding domain-containing protein [Streptomyces griseorubiginosus]AYC43828.1 Pyrroline-5-carboxylate reductase [Streptomyces griseorubiginosus]